MKLKPADKDVALIAWEARRTANAEWEPVDNSGLPAGAPMQFKCAACYGEILLYEGYLTRQELCYDCRDLFDAGWIVEMPPPGTGWNRR